MAGFDSSQQNLVPHALFASAADSAMKPAFVDDANVRDFIASLKLLSRNAYNCCDTQNLK